MHTRCLFILLALAPAATANAEDTLPIAGAWQAEPSPDFVGPSRLTISSEFIAFGPNREKVTRWNTDRDTVRVDTGSGHSYLFRQDTHDRICLVSSLRPVKALGSGAPAMVRCYARRGER